MLVEMLARATVRRVTLMVDPDVPTEVALTTLAAMFGPNCLELEDPACRVEEIVLMPTRTVDGPPVFFFATNTRLSKRQWRRKARQLAADGRRLAPVRDG